MKMNYLVNEPSKLFFLWLFIKVEKVLRGNYNNTGKIEEIYAEK